MKGITIGNSQYIECTACAVSIGDTTRQQVILERNLDFTAGDADTIFYDTTLEDIQKRFDEIDPWCLSRNFKDLETVLIDGQSLDNYCSGALI